MRENPRLRAGHAEGWIRLRTDKAPALLALMAVAAATPFWIRVIDQAGGRFIYFEGTYTASFSGAKELTPRYDCNQVMYRLRLDDPRLTPAR